MVPVPFPTVPELPEVEAYRCLAEGALGRPIASVEAPDAWFLKGGIAADGLRDALVGRSFCAARRLGKLLLLDTTAATELAAGGRAGRATAAPGGPVLGLRFGMTGRLVVDGRAGVEGLVYSSDREVSAWDRFLVRFADGGDLRVRDPRRLGGVFLDPREDALGPDVAALTPAALRAALGSSTAPLKARLMDQHRLAGVGNLLADEVLWRAGLDPRRPARSLTGPEVRRLHRHLRRVVDDLIARGGSHTGDLMAARVPGGRCPRDGAELTRATVGGRTTWWCPIHQR